MARICKACRQPVDDPRDHDCPEADMPEPESGSDGEAAASVAVSVSGSVITERGLLDLIRAAMPRRADRNWRGGWQLPGSAS